MDWVQARDGTRRYACEEHLRPLLRYGTADSLADLPATPDVVVCPGCDRLTLQADTGPVGVRCQACAPGTMDEAVASVQSALEDAPSAEEE